VKNRLSANDRPVHDWYRFVLSFPSHLVREYVARFELSSSHVLLDPFCGTGTVLVEAKKLGVPSAGIEPHPMAHLAASVKTDWAIDPDGLVVHSEVVAKRAQRAMQNPRPPQELSMLPPEAEALLIKDSISPLPLRKTLTLLSEISSEPATPYLKHQLLALARMLPCEIGNLRFGPEVGVGEIKPDAPVVELWLHAVRNMAADLRLVSGRTHVAAHVHRGDARAIDDVAQAGLVDAVITSPPYPNEKDYTRTTRLESVILGLINSKQELRRVKTELVRSNSRNVYRSDDDDQYIAGLREVEDIAAEIERRRIAMGKTSGFERQYPRVTRLNFGVMARHLAALRPVLKPGALLAYVVGDQASYLRVMIRTGHLLATIAKELGYEIETIDLFRTRFATATRAQLREEVVVLRWPG
jgi:DNA modification methylase